MDPVSIAAIGWGISTAGWIASPIVSKLMNKCISYLGARSSDKLKKLESKMLQLKLMLEAAEASAQRGNLEPWVRKLKSAFYDTEDILDEIDYHRLKSHVLHQSVNKTKQDVETMTNFNVPIESRKELTEMLDKLETLINEGDKLLSLLKLPRSYGYINNTPNNTVRSLNKTTSAPPYVFGREGDLEMIRRMLHDVPAQGEPRTSRTKCYSVISIHGIPGSGKTTLAQYVCKHEKEDDYFNPIMWIHVSQNFSVDAIFTEMLEIASSGRKKDKCSNLDFLQRQLEAELRNKRFFLVLDDVWYDKGVNEQQLDLLLSPLKVGQTGSKILVTTRTAEAAKALGAQNLIPISDLNEEQYSSMFMHYALDGAMISDSALLREYQLIGRKIAGKLGASPLAARTVAGQLRRKLDIEFWKRTLNRDLLNDTMGALWWSYQQLDEHVRQCFIYCCMFPRREELQREDLVRLWMAQGFVETTNGTEDIEDIGHSYFDDLLSCSFVQPKQKGTGGVYFTIHDLLHDLAERVTGGDFFKVEIGMECKIPQDVRHLFIKYYERRVFTEQVSNLKTLRTLFISDTCQEIDEDDLRLIMNLKKLRVVHLVHLPFSFRPMEKIIRYPACIGELKHLRYLCIGGGVDHGITMPNTITKLYHLQTLSGLLCKIDFSSVTEMCNLVNLRHLITLRGLEYPDLGRLTLLRTLDDFTVRKTRGYEIHQLEHLDNLHGTLCIDGLENVRSKEEANQAKLANKVHLSFLSLDWHTVHESRSGKKKTRKKHKKSCNLLLENQDSRKSKKPRSSCGQSPDPKDVLEALCPPSLVKSLSIHNYSGLIYPRWFLKEYGALENLQHLSFWYCNGLSAPPKNSKLFMQLHSLRIGKCSWYFLPENMTSLETLVIYDCEKILSLPRLPPSLKELQLTRWNGPVAPPEITEFLVNLQVLRIIECSWKSLPENMHRLTSLEELVVSNCENIMSLQMLPQSIKKLKIVNFGGSDATSIISKYMVNLHTLCISDCSFNSLPDEIECLTLLRELKIKNCKNIQSLPRLPLSLERLKLTDCNSSLVERCDQDPDLNNKIDVDIRHSDMWSDYLEDD